MSPRVDRRVNGDRGAAAVELALVLPFLLLLLFGMIDFGRAYNMQLSLTHAAREGARVAALGGTDTEAKDRAIQAAVMGSDPPSATVTTACPVVVTPSSDAVVTVTKVYDYFTPIQGILNVLGQPALSTPTITGVGRMRCNG